MDLGSARGNTDRVGTGSHGVRHVAVTVAEDTSKWRYRCSGPSCKTRMAWCHEFETGDLSVTDSARSGRQSACSADMAPSDYCWQSVTIWRTFVKGGSVYWAFVWKCQVSVDCNPESVVCWFNVTTV